MGGSESSFKHGATGELAINTIDQVMHSLRELYQLRVFENQDPYRVLIRTILSQRTRDENTDRAAAQLFAEYPTLDDVASASPEELEPLIRPAGFYHVKSRRIIAVSQMLQEEFGGVVPDKMKELLLLPGVGRKTANCVLVYAFHKPAIPVDVHVHRISNRLGLVETRTPEETELELERLVPREYWIELNDLLVQFGQTICRPVNPRHEICPLADICACYQDILEGNP